MKENWEGINGLRDGEPCSHRGCLSHISHPCEGCGRIAGKRILNCQTCTNSTKYPVGFWDGENSHGQIFDCHNLDCELKLNMLRNVVITEQEKELVKEANEKHKIFMDQIKVKRKELGITIMKMSQGLGISPSVYSDYEQCRNVVPLEIGDRIEGALSSGNYMNNLLKKYGRNG